MEAAPDASTQLMSVPLLSRGQMAITPKPSETVDVAQRVSPSRLGVGVG